MQAVAIARVNCIAIEGADARRFAQTQFAGNVESVSPGHWQWNAWLDAQGRVRALMHLVCLAPDHLLMVLRGGNVEAVCAELARFRMRSRIDLSIRRYTGLHAEGLPMGTVETHDADIALGYGERSLHLTAQPLEADPSAANTWQLADIRAGWPCLPVGATHFLSPALALEKLGAVAFDKGCYPGQEIVARLHYRGGHKFRLCHVRGVVPLVAGADPQPSDRGNVWVLVCASNHDGHEALIVCPLDTPIDINILQNLYHVISICDA